MAKNTYTNIIFDWDGCLAMTLDIWLSAYKQIFSKYGIEISDGDITHKVFGDWNGPMKFGVSDIQGFTNALLSVVNQNYPTVSLYKNARGMLERIRPIVKTISLLSSSKSQMVTEALKNTGVKEYIDYYVFAEDVAKHKPDPEGIIKIMTFANAQKNDTLLIGDSKSDLEAAQNAGIDSVLYFPSHNETFYEKEVLLSYAPTYIIADFLELAAIIKRDMLS